MLSHLISHWHISSESRNSRRRFLLTVDPTKMEHSPQLLRMFLLLKVCNLMKFLFQVIASAVYDSDALSKHDDSRLNIYLACESKLNRYVFSAKTLYINTIVYLFSCHNQQQSQSVCCWCF